MPVIILVTTRPLKYSLTLTGEEKILIKLCDHMSSKKPVIVPCSIRLVKFHMIIAPKTTLIKVKLAGIG